ncbi:unnamed protein product [Diamesa serratosioi]
MILLFLYFYIFLLSTPISLSNFSFFFASFVEELQCLVRRQLSNVQQSQILSDIQQHQHRFSSSNTINQQSQFGRNNFNGRQNFQQQPSVSVAFPPQTSVPQLVPQQAQLKQTQFQRSVLNQVGQPAFNQQQQQTQYNPFAQQQQQQQLPIQQFGGFQESFGQFRPNAAPLTQQAPIQSQQQFNQKQQVKVQQDHAEFLKKQQQIQESAQEKLRPQQSQLFQQNYQRQQGVQPADLSAFEKSVNNYYQQYPTTTTTTTTTPAPTTQRPIAVTTFNPVSVIPLKKSRSEVKTFNAQDIQALLQGNRQNLFSQLNQETEKPTKEKKTKSTKSLLGRDDLLKQLKLALSEENQDLGGQNFTSQDVVLPNGERVQVIRTSDPELIRQAKAGNNQIVEQVGTPTTTTIAPISLEDLAKSGIVPEGADFEVIRQSENGLQSVEKLPQQKKVTFVYLEEQDDGSYKVQGVKSNADKEAKRSGADVDNILKRIKNGELQLPPPAARVTRKETEQGIEIPTPAPNTVLLTNPTSITVLPLSTIPKNHRGSSTFNTVVRSSTPFPQTVAQTVSPSSQRSVFVSSTPNYEDNGRSPYSTLPSFATSQKQNFFTPAPRNRISISSTTEEPQYATASSINYITNAETQKYVSSTRGVSVTASPSYDSSPQFSSTAYSTASPFPSLAPVPSTSAPDLTSILRSAGLFAMSKYLKQSGLDSILNETGPYTIFAPTDKAFKSLLVQLGGPEKAEEKFKNNPRLLSGLLLHHVIPGSFKLEELQDEMTGVSLAGTQLRVNQYDMQDNEWNDVKVTTINGATVVANNNDVTIPQGIAHAIDRVMFPLPVGDILQTLQSDRERRFTHFLRAVFASDMADTLQNKGIKTYTVFAPTDAAFAHLTPEELDTMVSEKDTAHQLVARHILPSTLYTSGMRFYQVKTTLAEDKTLTVQKNGGKVKVNESTILTSNIPSTNGVIHAIDILL